MNVQGPDGAVIQFPDDMPPDQVKAALQKHYGAPGMPKAQTIKLSDVPGIHGVNEVGTGVYRGIVGTVKGLASLPGAVAGIPHQVTADIEHLRQDPSGTLKEWGQRAAGMVGGPAAAELAGGHLPTEGEVGESIGSVGSSALLGRALPTATKAVVRRGVMELPGASVELHAMAEPRLYTLADNLAAPPGETARAYADVARMGNPKLYMGNLRSTALSLLREQEQLAEKGGGDPAFRAQLEKIIHGSTEGWTFQEAVAMSKDIGRDLSGFRTTGAGARPGELPGAGARKYDADLRRLFGAIDSDLQTGKPIIVKKPAQPAQPASPIVNERGEPMRPAQAAQPAVMEVGAPDEQAIAQSDRWHQARALARRDFVSAGLKRELVNSTNVAGTGADVSFGALPKVIKQLVQAKNKARLGDKAAKLFVGSFQPGELDNLIAQMREIRSGLSRIPPPSGAITGSSRMVGKAIGGGAGAHYFGLPWEVGALAGIGVPEAVSRAMQPAEGRAFVRWAARIDPSTGPVFQHALALLMRTQNRPEIPANPEPEPLPAQTVPALTTPPVKPGPENIKGPAATQFYRQQAEGTLGGADAEREHVEQLAAVQQQVHGGKVPRVDKDLRRGRLTVPALKQTLTKVTQQNAKGLLDYMGPEDAMHMLAVAQPQERAWLVPLVRTKLMQIAKLPTPAGHQAARQLAELEAQGAAAPQ